MSLSIHAMYMVSIPNLASLALSISLPFSFHYMVCLPNLASISRSRYAETYVSPLFIYTRAPTVTFLLNKFSFFCPLGTFAKCGKSKRIV